jgi:hypothetical protein
MTRPIAILGFLTLAATSQAFAATTILVCPANNGSFVWSIDLKNKTVSSSSEGAPYTVAAIITEQKISWDAPSGVPGTHYPTSVDRVTGAVTRAVCTPQGGCTGGLMPGNCHKGEKIL